MRMQHLGYALILSCGTSVAAGQDLSAADCFMAGFNANDADAVSACYAEDAVIWFPGGSMAQGRAAIRDGFAHYLQEVAVKDIRLTEMGSASNGDTKTAWGTFVIEGSDKASGKPFRETGRYTDVSRKVDGKWVYLVDHPSMDPEQDDGQGEQAPPSAAEPAPAESAAPEPADGGQL